MAKSSNYSILVDAQLNLDDIEKKLKSKKYEIPLDTSSIKSGKKDIDLIKKALEEPYELETFFVAPSEGLYLENIKY